MRSVVRSAIVAFVLSRALFYGLVLIGAQIAFLQKVYSNSVWETRIVFQAARVGPEMVRTTMVGDAWFYRAISERGYDRGPVGRRQGNWAFFPLYPLITRFVALPIDWAFRAMLVSNAALLGALLVFGAVAMRAGAAAEDAERAVWYLAFFPTSYFLSLPLTESLFLLLSLGAILMAFRDRWWAAGLLGGLAALTRVNGALLLLPLAILAWRNRARWNAIWLLLVPCGTAAYMLYLQRITGNALAFRDVQANWGRAATWIWTPLVRFLSDPRALSEPWNFVAFNFAIAILVLVCGIVLLVRREWAFGVYTLASLMLPLVSGSLQSLSRYALVIFPLFLWLAFLGRSRTIDRVITAISITLFGWFTALFTLRVDFAFA